MCTVCLHKTNLDSDPKVGEVNGKVLNEVLHLWHILKPSSF